MNIDTYIYGTSFYHRFDIRAKLLFTFIYCTCIFFIHSWYGLLFSVLVPLVLFIVSLGKRETIRAVRKILPVLILLFLFLPLQDRLSEPVLSIKSVAIVTEDGLYRVLRLASRFTSLSLTLMLLIATERSERIISGLRYYHLPYKVALLFSLILRFIPYLGSVFEAIKDSMSLRLTEGRRGIPIMPSITAFAVSAVKMIPDTAAALEERGFGRKGRTEYSSLEKNRKLFTELLFSVILPIIFFIIMR